MQICHKIIIAQVRHACHIIKTYMDELLKINSLKFEIAFIFIIISIQRSHLLVALKKETNSRKVNQIIHL